MVKKFVPVLIVLSLITPPAQASIFFSFPKGGGFKQVAARQDSWYYLDEQNWYIKAPDKWQHMMGSYAGGELLGLVMDRRLAGGLVLGLGLLKEIEDGYREGWSPRDILMDATGVAASLLRSRKCHLWCDWRENSILITFSIRLH